MTIEDFKATKVGQLFISQNLCLVEIESVLLHTTSGGGTQVCNSVGLITARDVVTAALVERVLRSLAEETITN
jgi:hypothetical protein